MSKTTFNPSKPLTDLRDVINFFEFLYLELKCVYHPDDDFTTYIHLDSKQPSFSKGEGEMLNKRMEEAFDVCGREDKDIYQLGMETNLLSEQKEKTQLSNQSKKKQRARKQR
jgi:hypothetical protein